MISVLPRCVPMPSVAVTFPPTSIYIARDSLQEKTERNPEQ